MNKLFLGSHISLNKSNKYLLGVVEESIYNGATSFMIFTGAPHNKNRVPVSSFFMEEAVDLGRKHGIDFSNAVVHAPYIINLANPDPDNEQFNIDHFVNEISRTNDMGIPYIVLHPGYHVDQTLDEGIERLIVNLKKVLERTEHFNVCICLETMAGKRNQLGSSLEELARIIDGCNGHRNLGVCLDIVHLHDAGYDVTDKEGFLNEVNRVIGLSRVKVLHIGDSANPRGSKKDVHANFNYGHIGFDVAIDWIYDNRFSKMPIIVETPFWVFMDGGRKKLISPYKHEIQLIKNRRWEKIPDERFKPR